MPDLAAGSDSGDSSSDDVTNMTTLTVRVSAEVGGLVRLFADGVEVGQAVARRAAGLHRRAAGATAGTSSRRRWRTWRAT